MPEWIESLHWGALFQIVIIDILLSGDNAVVIALACRNLHGRHRLLGIVWGTFGAILMRVLLVFFALRLFDVPYLQMAGGLLLLWVGIRLLQPEDEAHDLKGSASIWGAVRTILIADFIMSLDNIIAIAGAAQNAIPDHQIAYVVFGLVLSMPIMIWGSALILKLIDRFSIIVSFGAALLGWIAGGMILGDIAMVNYSLTQESSAKWAAGLLGALIVVPCGHILAARKTKAPAGRRHGKA